MSDHTGTGDDIRLQPSGAEAGTAPGDRRFRPDVQGLRAVAVLLVVLYHANVPHVGGGAVGVDVFFVISGFVITGLLLRERAATGSTSIAGFYARRVRRILPAATLCILVTVALAYLLVGVGYGKGVADDGRWAAVFLFNYHYVVVGPTRPEIPLANFWSLAVEEQFYVVYPTLVLVVGLVARRIPFQARLGALLVAVIVGSYWWSLVQTSRAPFVAFVSPFTRAWELALGGLLALSTPVLRRLPAATAAILSWAGLAAILGAAVLTGDTVRPASLGVVGAALVIAGGTAVPAFGAERLLSLAPFAFVGKRSYAWYLWHYPLLILVGARTGTYPISVHEALIVVAVSFVVAAVTYALVENPVRRARLSPRRSLALGGALVGGTVALLTAVIALS